MLQLLFRQVQVTRLQLSCHLMFFLLSPECFLFPASSLLPLMSPLLRPEPVPASDTGNLQGFVGYFCLQISEGLSVLLALVMLPGSAPTAGCLLCPPNPASTTACWTGSETTSSCRPRPKVSAWPPPPSARRGGRSAARPTAGWVFLLSLRGPPSLSSILPPSPPSADSLGRERHLPQVERQGLGRRSMEGGFGNLRTGSGQRDGGSDPGECPLQRFLQQGPREGRSLVPVCSESFSTVQNVSKVILTRHELKQSGRRRKRSEGRSVSAAAP